MKDALEPGLKFEFKYTVPESKTVPYFYPKATEFQLMPQVLATGFTVGLIEWACVDFINRYVEQISV
jgi:fluoroacetyl-CoA thioesterase